MSNENTPEFNALRRDIQAGIADIAAGRVSDFDAGDIIRRGQTRFASNKHRVCGTITPRTGDK